jgi:agmatinase
MGKYIEVENSPELILIGITHGVIKPALSNQQEFLDTIHIEAKKHESILAVGGDHSISYPLVFAFKERYPDGKLIVFDAHPDCEVHTETPTHEDWLRMLIEGGVIKPEDVFLVGTRKITKREQEFMKKHGLEIYKEVPELGAPLYLSIDIDVLDPSVCSGFYFKEPGGLKIDELKSMIEDLKPNVKFADIVEVLPDDKTIEVARQLVSIFI